MSAPDDVLVRVPHASPSVKTGVPSRSERVRRLLRYTGVNLLTVTLDYVIFLKLARATGHPTTSSIVAYAAALVLNYLLTKKFVFGSDGQQKSEKRLFTEFLLTGLLGLVLTATVTYVGVHILGMKEVVAKTTAVLICFVVLYAIRSRLVFQRVE